MLHKKKIISFPLFALLLLILPSPLYANTDFTLSDDAESGKITVNIDSNDDYIDGLDMTIVMSENVSINEESLPADIDLCTLGGRTYLMDKKIHIECFNEAGAVMDGVLATISYTATDPDYYFYIDQDSLDLGLKESGTILNINYEQEADTEETSDKTDTSTVEKSSKFASFLSDNIFYIAGGVVLVITVIVILMMREPKGKKVEDGNEKKEDISSANSPEQTASQTSL